MKKIILTAIYFALFTKTLFSQVVSDVKETDCNNKSMMLYEVLNSSKVVVIAADGYDCGICQSHASSVKALAENDPSKISVWGAMNFKYNSNAPTCNNLSSWVGDYSWSSVFTFNDNDKSWAAGGYPTYTVINPNTKSVEYRGSNITTASNKAKEIASTITSTDDQTISQLVNLNYNSQTLYISTANPMSEMEVYDVIGNKIVSVKNLNALDYSGNINLKNGIYIVRYVIDTKNYSKKILVNE